MIDVQDSKPSSPFPGRVLVVGGNGFIGRHIVRHLLSAGAEVVIFDIAPAPPEFSHLSQIIGSVSDSALLSSAVAGCKIVIFLANSSLPGTANMDLSVEVQAHVRSTVKAAEICNDQGVERFIFASSGGTVYGYSSEDPLREDMATQPRNAYGVSKLSIEHYLRIIRMQRNMDTISLRISNPYGDGQIALRNQGFIAAAMQNALQQKTISIWGDGHVERDFVHVSDVARAFVAACRVADLPEVVNIGSGRAVSLLEILRLIEAEMGRPVSVTFEPSRGVDVSRNVLCVERAQQTLGWMPEVGLEAGLRQTLRWWQETQSKTCH